MARILSLEGGVKGVVGGLSLGLGVWVFCSDLAVGDVACIWINPLGLALSRSVDFLAFGFDSSLFSLASSVSFAKTTSSIGKLCNRLHCPSRERSRSTGVLSY